MRSAQRQDAYLHDRNRAPTKPETNLWFGASSIEIHESPPLTRVIGCDRPLVNESQVCQDAHYVALIDLHCLRRNLDRTHE